MEGAAPERRTQTERRNAAEEALLDAAAQLIAERGIDRASLARIGERAGTSRGLATHHFGSKDALVAGVVGRTQDHIAAVTVAALERTHRKYDEVSALDVVRATVATYLDLFESPSADDRALLVLWGATFPSEASLDGMAEADRRSCEGWAELITRGQHEGSITNDADATATAAVLMGVLRGVAAVLSTESGNADVRSVRATCDAWIVAALAPSSRHAGIRELGRTGMIEGEAAARPMTTS